MLLTTLVLLLLAAETASDIASDDELRVVGLKMHCPTGSKYDASLQRCCTQCAIGQGVALPCNNRNDTVCEVCRAGVEYSAVLSHTHSCEYCFKCPPNARQTHQCNVTHNTKCECVRGFYARSIGYEGRFSCETCTQCPKGTKIIRHCDPLSDTACESCPTGTFNSQENSEQCVPCSTCEKGIAKQCTPEHDTICVGSPLVQNMTDAPTRHGIGEGMSGSTLVPIYCIALGCLFIGLLIYAIVKQKHTKKNTRWCCDSAQQKHVPRDVYQAVPVDNRSHYSDSRRSNVVTSTSLLQTSTCTMPLTDDCIELIGDFLDQSSVVKNGMPLWMHVARRMGEQPTETTARSWLTAWHKTRAQSQQVPILFECLREHGGQNVVNYCCRHCNALQTV